MAAACNWGRSEVCPGQGVGRSGRRAPFSLLVAQRARSGQQASDGSVDPGRDVRRDCRSRRVGGAVFRSMMEVLLEVHGEIQHEALWCVSNLNLEGYKTFVNRTSTCFWIEGKDVDENPVADGGGEPNH